MTVAALDDATARCRDARVRLGTGPGGAADRTTVDELRALSLAAVVRALGGEAPDGKVWAGALRHFGSWRSRPVRDLARVPEHVWRELEALARRRGDESLARKFASSRDRYGRTARG